MQTFPKRAAGRSQPISKAADEKQYPRVRIKFYLYFGGFQPLLIIIIALLEKVDAAISFHFR